MEQLFKHEIEYLIELVQRDIDEFPEILGGEDNKKRMEEHKIALEFFKEIKNKLKTYKNGN